MRFPEWAIRQEAAKLQREIGGLRGHVGDLEAALQAEQAQSVNLRKALQAEQAQTANLRSSLQLAQAQMSNLSSQLETERGAKLKSADATGSSVGTHLSLDAHLALPSFDRAIGRALKRVHTTGDRLTGGGLRSMASRVLTTSVQLSMRNRWIMPLGRTVLRPFPKVATSLYQLATKQDVVATFRGQCRSGIRHKLLGFRIGFRRGNRSFRRVEASC